MSSIKTFAILDVEVNDYHQYQFNTCSLIELCLYGISAKCLLQNDIKKNGRETKKAPRLPRVLNKINLMINPRKRIHDNTRTGLDNYMLENEASFDDDTADCILKFLNRLEKPVCLVAHNGMRHDFRLIRHVYAKLKLIFPSSIYCVDSLDAFRKIDKAIAMYENTLINESPLQTNEENDLRTEQIVTTSDETNEHIKEIAEPSQAVQDLENLESENSKDSVNITNEDGGVHNVTMSNNKRLLPSNLETTPKRRKGNDDSNQQKDQDIHDISSEGNCMEGSPKSQQQINETTPSNRSVLPLNTQSSTSSSAERISREAVKKISRQLDFDTKVCSYELGKLYKYLFKDEKCEKLHEAEADVMILTQLILHYGISFLEYANENKQTFDKVPMLGSYSE